MRRRCASPKTTKWSTHSRRIDPISRSAKPFCQGEAGAARHRAPQGGSPHGPQLSRPFKRRYHQRRARRRRIQLPPPTQVAEAFAVPNLDRNRWHISVQIQLKRTFFTDDYIKKTPLELGLIKSLRVLMPYR